MKTEKQLNKFIKENRKFWSQFPIKNSGKKLLIEEPGRIYTKAIFTMIVNQAKGYVPVWLCGKSSQQHQLIRSYFPDAEIITTGKKWLPRKLYAFIIALFKFVKILFTKDILGFHYNGVKYGDIIYDTYLYKNKVSTIKKINFKLIKVLAIYIFRHIRIKTILQNGSYAGVLVSHLTASSGVMMRSALRYGYKAYLCTGRGDYSATLHCFKKLEEITFPRKTPRSDIDQIIKQFGPKLKKTFLKTFEQKNSGRDDLKNMSAFSKNNPYFSNRASFNQYYKLDPNKKNIFVMLHAFNDHPHTHFRWMIFNDYYDWFIQTLEFAKTNKKFNWIFKQHPYVRHYMTKDVNFKKLFSKCPNNIIYIDENNQINTKSLIHCADLIVTTLGSSGFELPALGAIPSIAAGDNSYNQLGFALEPKTKEEYFATLNKTDKIEKITTQAQKRAQAAYIYFNKISKVNISIYCPASGRAIKNKIINPQYWKSVCNLYSTKRNTILKELNYCIKAVQKPGFKKLTSQICPKKN